MKANPYHVPADLPNAERASVHADFAEDLLATVATKRMKGPDVQIVAARANTHATLAVYYASRP